ncbi:MAG: LPP20 family lipoprotein [Candidatus Cloacimonetes bacterium]|nr:LPP20 family lipoprotein [Candidatus Cloacimonadota bacterium]
MVNRKIVIYFLILILFSASLTAYSRSEIEAMRNDVNWIVGIGKSPSETKSDQLAIKDLLSQITIQVEASFKDILTEENGTVSEYCSSAIDTYSSARLDAAERSIFEEDGRYIVYRYIKKEEKNKIFFKREKLIKDYARRGNDAEQELRIGDALMNYYWSLVLLRTHPDWDKITETFNFQEESLVTFLPDRIRRIYSLIDLKIENKWYDPDYDLTLINISAFFQNQPVRNLDLKYYLGSDWSVPVGVSQGKALFEFMGNLDEIPDILKINVLYNDLFKANHNADLRKVLEDMLCPAFRESRFEIPLKEISIVETEPDRIEIKAVDYGIPVDKYIPLTSNIIESIKTKKMDCVLNNLTQSGSSSFEDIIIYGNAKILDDSPELYADKINGRTYIRGFPVQFDFPNSGRRFNEQLVFVINEDDKIEKVNFALSDKAKDDILGKVVASDEEKFLIANFIEEYKTAYCTENIEFIEKIFDDNALIIVGQMLKEDDKNIDDMYKKLGRNWQPVRYSKQQYIRNLKTVFEGNEYVNLHFEDNKVTRVNSDTTKVFGIQIHQYYYSQRYSDEGYLFLMFDLTKQDEPKIYVRTWQPEKNADGSIYGLDDFYLPNQ